LFSNGVEICQPVDSVSIKNRDKACCSLERFQIGSTQMQTKSDCVTMVASSLDIRKNTGTTFEKYKIIAKYTTNKL
jgi:hypothetical protein